MCGIAAIFGTCRDDRSDLVLGMLRKIRHRGDPEHFGEIREFPNGAMGTNRLAIVARGAGRQPMGTSDGRYWVVFNGEIYNHRVVRDQLETLGHHFATTCDTEVLAHAYQEWGKAMLGRIDGQFAFVVFDAEARSYFAARDPLGIKPLYWACQDGTVFFASEQKCLVGHAGDIRELPPGNYLERGVAHRYFDIETEPAVGDGEDPARCCRRLLAESVRKRVDTDLPLAVMFSGGIDSAVVLHLARQFHPNVTAFTMGLPGAADLAVATRYCRELGIPQVICPLGPRKLIRELPRVIREAEFFEGIDAMDACVAHFGYQKARAKGFKVALCGEGSDEVLMGYDLFVGHPQPQELMRYRVANLHRTDLQRVDRAAMLNGVEARVPFLDIDFLRFAYHLHPSLKLRGGTTKWILREAFRSELPDYILWRPKVRMPDGTGLHSLLHDYAGRQRDCLDTSLRRRLAIENVQQAFFLQTYLSAGLPIPRERFRRPGLDYNANGYFHFVT